MGWYTPQSVAPDLSDILVCGWTACAEGEHLLVPDACMDVLWIRGVGIRVCGPETAAWSFTLPPGTRSVGVRFRPGSASPMLRTSASELRDSRADLSAVTDARTERILLNRLENSEDHEQVSILESAVRSWASSSFRHDPVINHVRTALSEHSWNVTTLADAAALTSRQLQRRCNDAFGYGPATLRSILRLQRFMALARSRPALGLAESAAHCGFSDQAHLTRECRRISSLTPAALLRTQAPDWHGSETVVALTEGDAVA
ncbi:helix-turn-helix domain-containing protein [Rhodococcus erythropolis]|uniref:helix-turn-helix domain-containing protein n=1 Tax=Rhodococcus erythropolis TaxID=1833 RepID=UPI0022B3157E|nr:helix-turn-helix domain-containing protein [Rhodococcus erythropolis]MCZ4567332.1 helix-turn-helix domain-containing protein [Rhodococcus erythropolis]